MENDVDDSKKKVLVSVPHVEQKSSWDCGLACSLMVLKHFKKNCDDFQELCSQLDFGRSVWTMDLANIMKHYDIKHHLCTITMGVDKGYSKQNFYKAAFTSDEVRINKLFEERKKLGLSAEERTVSLQDILTHVSNQQVAIVLIDWNVCRKLLSDSVKCLPMTCVGKFGSVYQGHFVVVCGYSKEDKVIYYQNPAVSSKDVSKVSFKTFEAARKSYGTDEDILFLYSS